jgi:hypothetical protein
VESSEAARKKAEEQAKQDEIRLKRLDDSYEQRAEHKDSIVRCVQCRCTNSFKIVTVCRLYAPVMCSRLYHCLHTSQTAVHGISVFDSCVLCCCSKNTW